MNCKQSIRHIKVTLELHCKLNNILYNYLQIILEDKCFSSEIKVAKQPN